MEGRVEARDLGEPREPIRGDLDRLQSGGDVQRRERNATAELVAESSVDACWRISVGATVDDSVSHDVDRCHRLGVAIPESGKGGMQGCRGIPKWLRALGHGLAPSTPEPQPVAPGSDAFDGSLDQQCLEASLHRIDREPQRGRAGVEAEYTERA